MKPRTQRRVKGSIVLVRDENLSFQPHVPRKAVLNMLKHYDPMEDFRAYAAKKGVTQREFLLAAQYVCQYGRKQLAQRLGCGLKVANKWYASEESADHNGMSPIVWKYLAEIMLQADPSLAAPSK
jgi:hypothetical protein